MADLQPLDAPPVGTASGGVVSATALPQLLYPLPEPAAEVDPYGWRWSDSRQVWRIHAGADLIVAEGTPVLAMAPGRVVLADVFDGYGLTVLLDHGHGWQSLYAHLLDTPLKPGDSLRAGERIGRVGQSGRATTPHLHVELRHRREDRSGEPVTVMAVDPSARLSEALQRLPVQQARGMTPAMP